jgi:hypothetical protein
MYAALLLFRRMRLNTAQIIIYACLGFSQAIFTFFMGAMLALFTYHASQRLHKVSHLTITLLDFSHYRSGCYRARDARANVFLRNHCK